MGVKTIALFLNHPNCSVQSVNGVMAACPDYRYKIFTKHPVPENFFNDVDIICCPGGLGHSDTFDSIFAHHRDSVRDFILRGKPYLGICMGAYWCDQHYLDVLQETRVVQYIKQPGTCTRRPHAKAIPICWEGIQDHMFFYDGCTFVGGYYQTIATYDNTQMPMAIIQQNMALVGCHPEAENFWHSMYSYINIPRNPLHSVWLNQLVEKLWRS